MASSLIKTLVRSSSRIPSSSRKMCLVSSQISNHTAKGMQDTSKKSPMELINEVPPIKVEGRIVACEGDHNPPLGHPIEFICLDKAELPSASIVAYSISTIIIVIEWVEVIIM